MKKVLNALFLTLLVALTFSACSDVPAPYDILTDGDLNIKGDGTKENPYDIAAASMKQDGSVAWIQGYIVGSAEGASLADGSKFEAPFTGASNILIADSPTEKDYKKCIPVQLVASTELRTKLNLVDNPANLGQVVTIKGTLENYFKQAGMKAPVAAVINGQEIGDGGGSEPSGSLAELLNPANPVNEVINTFDDAATDVEYTKAGYVNFAEAGGRTWRGKPFNGNGLIQATAYGSKDASVISWFVTPAVNVAQMTSKKLTFDCISAYYKDGNKLEVYFLEKEGTTLKETLLNVGTLPQNAEGYSEAKTLSADLSSLSGKTGFIGFKYVGSSTASGTYQIDNLYVGVEPGENPGPGPDPVEGKLIFTEIFGSNVPANILSASTPIANFTHWDNSYTYTATTADIRAIAHKTPENMEETAKVNNIWFPAAKAADFTIDGIDLTGYSKFVVVYEAASNAYQLTETDNLNKLKLTLNGQEVTPPSKEIVGNKITSGIFHEMKVEIAVAGTNNSTLKFSTDGVANTLGLRLYNIRLYAVTGGGGEEPTPGKVYTSNITLPTGTATDANKASGGDVTVDSQNYSILKLGTSSALGFWNTPTLEAGATKLSFFAVGWTGKTGQLTVVIENGGTFTGGATSKVIALNGTTAGAAGNPPFTIIPADSDYFEYTMTGITASSTIKFTTDGATGDKRAIIFGINIKK